jgi:hypothetical protein
MTTAFVAGEAAAVAPVAATPQAMAAAVQSAANTYRRGAIVRLIVPE